MHQHAIHGPRHCRAVLVFAQRFAAWLRAAVRRDQPDTRPLDQRVREIGEW